MKKIIKQAEARQVEAYTRQDHAEWLVWHRVVKNLKRAKKELKRIKKYG